MIKSGGEWISSIDLENLAVGHPDVMEAGAIGVPHPKWGERPLLVIVPKSGRQPTAESILDYMAGRLPKWMVPDAVVMVKGRADRKNEGEVKLVALEITAFEATADFGVVRLRLDARDTPAAIIQELKSLIGEFPGDAPVVLEVQTTDGPKTLRFGPEFKVRPDGDFFAEAKALLGDAALIA